MTEAPWTILGWILVVIAILWAIAMPIIAVLIIRERRRAVKEREERRRTRSDWDRDPGFARPSRKRD